MDSVYRDEIIEHYKHPRNFGSLDDPDVHVEANNPLCGDRLSMDLKVRDGVVQDVRFTGRGCAISQASASMLTEQMVGAHLEDLAKTTRDDILDNLGIEVSYARMKCATLSLGLLRLALVEAGVSLSDYPNEDEA
ncbi:MAG: SUF system NifU family Fe-S cluster assembly protein [Chloroflexota bacterium]|nr:SUF system NifU family Fe-S cluster assembly protein [Chloroflexota bacterium]